MSRILVVDDEEMLLVLLREHLEDDDYEVITADSGENALEKLKMNPDLILLDVNMPDTDGFTFCRAVRKAVTCPIIFLTARTTEQDAVNGFGMGGDDYITKPFSLNMLSARISAHLRREERTRQEHHLLVSNNLLVDLSARTISYQGREINLSKYEFGILEFLIANPNSVFDKEYIYEAVWGYDAEGDSNVIKEHIRKLRKKLYDATGNEYIDTVWGMGYRWKK